MEERLNEGAALPPRGQRRWYKIISPTRGEPLACIIYGHTFTARWTHYVPPTLPCAETPDCQWCKAGVAPRYNGYIAAGQNKTGEPRVLALTYNACCQFTDLLKMYGTLRGMRVILRRLYQSDRAPISVSMHGIEASPRLPEPFDVVDSLSRMWGVNRDFMERGCRRIGADENAQQFLKAEAERKANPGAIRAFKPDEVG